MDQAGEDGPGAVGLARRPTDSGRGFQNGTARQADSDRPETAQYGGRGFDDLDLFDAEQLPPRTCQDNAGPQPVQAHAIPTLTRSRAVPNRTPRTNQTKVAW